MRRTSPPSCFPLRALRFGQLFAMGALLASFSTGCTLFLRSTPNPLPSQTTRNAGAAPTATLVVFLPGRGGSIADFEQEGLLKIMTEAGITADVVSADAHLGYYYQRTVIDRLKTDILIPARADGYRRIVLVGLSLGGLGGLLCERDQPGSVDALVLLAPYLGDRASLFTAINAAGGPTAWARNRVAKPGDIEEELWSFIGTRHPHLPPTWLLYGEGDSLAPGHRLLATLLPPERVIAIEGAHDWRTWRSLWQQVCQQTDLFAAEKAR